MLKVRTVVATTLTILMLSVRLPVLAVSHLGGEWNYGGSHEPGNWGAFSSYYHGYSWHWSYVGSISRNNQQTAYAGEQSSSYAFINTNIGEKTVFDAGKCDLINNLDSGNYLDNMKIVKGQDYSCLFL